MDVHSKFKKIYEMEKSGDKDGASKLRQELKEFIMGKVTSTTTQVLDTNGSVNVTTTEIASDELPTVLAMGSNIPGTPGIESPCNTCPEASPTNSIEDVPKEDIAKTLEPTVDNPPVDVDNLANSCIVESKGITSLQELNNIMADKKIIFEDVQRDKIKEFISRNDLKDKKFTKFMGKVIENINNFEDVDFSNVTPQDLKEFNISIQKALSSYITHALIEQEKNINEDGTLIHYLGIPIFTKMLHKSFEKDITESIKDFIVFFKELNICESK